MCLKNGTPKNVASTSTKQAGYRKLLRRQHHYSIAQWLSRTSLILAESQLYRNTVYKMYDQELRTKHEAVSSDLFLAHVECSSACSAPRSWAENRPGVFHFYFLFHAMQHNIQYQLFHALNWLFAQTSHVDIARWNFVRRADSGRQLYISNFTKIGWGVSELRGSKIAISHWLGPRLIQQLVLVYKPWYYAQQQSLYSKLNSVCKTACLQQERWNISQSVNLNIETPKQCSRNVGW